MASQGTSIVVLLLLLLFVGVGFVAASWPGAITAFIGFMIILAIPVGTWTLLLPPVSGKLFETFLVKRKFEDLLRRFHVNMPSQSEYFRVEPKFPKSTTWRFFQVISVVFGIASYLTLLLRGLSVVTVQSEPIAFLLVAFAILSVGVPLIVGILWVYEDAGVRRIDSQTNTVSRMGTPLEQFFVGFGFAGTFARFASSLQADPAAAWGTAVAILILLMPICAFASVYFHTQYYAGVVRKFLVSTVGRDIPRKKITLQSQ